MYPVEVIEEAPEEVIEEAEVVPESIKFQSDLPVEKLKELGAYYEFINGQSVPLTTEELLNLGAELANLNHQWNDEDLERAHYTELAKEHKKSADSIQKSILDVARNLRTKRKPLDDDYFILEDFDNSVMYIYDKTGRYCDTRTMTPVDRQRKMRFNKESDAVSEPVAETKEEEEQENIEFDYDKEESEKDIYFLNN